LEGESSREKKLHLQQLEPPLQHEPDPAEQYRLLPQ
jgi:hypothetical protein